jgi:hypothetical protein
MSILLDGTTGITTPDLTDTSLTSGRVVYAGTGGNLTGSSNLVFDGTNLGIGNTSPLGLLQLGSDAGTGEATNRGNLILVNQTGTGVGSTKGIELKGSPSGSGYGVKLYMNNNSDYFGIATRFSSAAWTERLTISESNGNVTLTNNLSVGGATPTTSGTGITFPATQSASSDANTLDDYEEGTWTPVLSFGGGSTGITYIAQVGTYTKIGKLVTFVLSIQLANKGSSTGAASIAGLPFTVSSAASYCIYAQDVSFADMLLFHSDASTTTINTRQITNAGSASNLTNSNYTNTTLLYISGHYYV